MVKLPPAQLSYHELAKLTDMAVISHAQTPIRDGLSVPEQYMEKLNYSIEFIRTKQYALQDHMHQQHAEKLRLMADLGKSMDRDIVRLDYKTKGKKKRKKKKKKKSENYEYDMMSPISSPKNIRPTKASDITDEVIVSTMNDTMMKKAKKEPAVKKLTMEINRDITTKKNIDKRVTEIEDKNDLIGLYCMDHYFNEQNCSAAPYEFRRQQSRLYQKLHSGVEINIEEVEAALQQANNKLLSDREFKYIYIVLDLPKRDKINFRLFHVVAALPEKVTHMDHVIQKLINKVDFNALDIIMGKSKELFQLLKDETQMHVGNAPADILAVELTAGGLTHQLCAEQIQ
ncbi:uncharacterized protein LOC127880252 [Dreissena polymorpha]|nr:uncharacterized protein LOC127880252 [Dreissena polymorpha]